jgi:glutaconate CoA-transferase, subunit B
MATSLVKPSERMAARASAELKSQDVVFVGIGLPNLACNLARATHAPELFMIYESGAVGTVPERLPVSIGDPTLVTDSLAILSQADIFQLFLQGGMIEVGFLGGAQVDRYGNLNTTVIGDYHSPKVRLPGSGGACEIATHSKRLLIMMAMTPRTFVPLVDFVTSPGHRFISKRTTQGVERSKLELPGSGPTTVITDLGVCQFRSGEMVLTEIYSGVTLDQVRKQCGWELKIADTVEEVPPPSESIVRILREKLDPQCLYL